MAGVLTGATVMAGLAVFGPAALARPPAAQTFCSIYPDTHACAEPAKAAPCATCHTVAPAMNLFGTQLKTEIRNSGADIMDNAAFVAALNRALRAVEGRDADNDGITNLAELVAGSRPEDAQSKPVVAGCTPAERAAGTRALWNACGYDPAYAFRKVTLDFCGKSPTRAETTAFAALAGDRAKWEPALAQALDRCLGTAYWAGRDGVLWNLANSRVDPITSIKSGANPGAIPLADYQYDYDLFTYANTGDRDVRDLLTSQYFVRRTSDAPPAFQRIADPELARARQAGQTVAPDRRAGMLTTRWFTTVNTMFTAMPRTTAATAYREYLGFDISKMEGLHPITAEPADYDAKGVAAPECAVCHSTLDPLTYPFSRYNGIASNNYAPNRLSTFVRTDGARIVETPESGIILGQEVANLLEWAQVAANSDAFAQKVTWDYWRLLVGRAPAAGDQAEFTQMWQGLKAPERFNYRVENMLHALVLTSAYGTP